MASQPKLKRIRIPVSLLLAWIAVAGLAQYPYVKKLNYPEQLPTQKIFDMLSDSRGYLWTGTDKGLYRYNGRSFVEVPFDKTTSHEVAYLQEDRDGTIWCMNFYNQLFYYRDDTLRRFEIVYNKIRNATTFNNVIVGSHKIWFQSSSYIYEVDRATRSISEYPYPGHEDLILASCLSNETFYAYSYRNLVFTSDGDHHAWRSSGLPETYVNMRMLGIRDGALAIPTALSSQHPFEIKGNSGYSQLKQADIQQSSYIIGGTRLPNGEYWLYTYTGAYRWDKATGKTTCFLPGERVSDVVMDYQGNYWFSTLDNGLFLCTSLFNTIIKVYNNSFLDNLIKLEPLPDGEILTGNAQGYLSSINLQTGKVFKYDTAKGLEMDFLYYDTLDKVIFSKKGVFSPNKKTPVEDLSYSKGVTRDRFGNIIAAFYNAALVLSGDYGNTLRHPVSCPLYRRPEMSFVLNKGRQSTLVLRQKRSNAVLSARNKEGFWVAYEDGLYEYHYDGTIRVLSDKEHDPVVAKCLIQLADGTLAVGTSTRGIRIFNNGREIKAYTEKDGLSSPNIKRIIEQDHLIWALTDAGLDRVDQSTGTVTNYLEEYGLSNIIISDFNIQEEKMLFATPAGILQRYNVPSEATPDIRFPLLSAKSNGQSVQPGTTLPDKSRDVVFYFEALHYLSSNALVYRYRMRGLDTLWHPLASFASQAAFNRLSPGSYLFEIQAMAGANYKSAVRSFSFSVSRPYWQEPWVWLLGFMVFVSVAGFFLLRWRKRLISRQSAKAQLLKSQLVALRAQMNPHFLYNVLNTVQGLVYGNRRAAAGELLGNFSDLMRKVLQSSDKQLLPLDDEVENLRLYLELEKARFDQGFSYSINMVNIEDTSAIYVPSLLLQPFAENAIKHGLMHKQGNKKLEILFERTGNLLKVIIDDDGIGRQRSMEINQRQAKKPTAFATQALSERVELFNRLHRHKISYQVIDKQDASGQPTGTRIELIIPDYQPREGSL